MVEPLRHRQTKGAATDMFYLTPPRHISTLPQKRTSAFRGIVPVQRSLLAQRLQNLHQFRVDMLIAADHMAGFQRIVVAFDA